MKTTRFLPIAQVALLLAFVILAVQLHGTIANDRDLWMAPMDHHKYLAMASRGVGEFHIAPFCWRIGPSALASLFPLEEHAHVFQFISMLGIVVTILATGSLVRRRTGSDQAAFFVVAAMLGVGWFSRGLLYYAINVDAAALAFGSLALIAHDKKADALAIAVLMVGALCKEIIMLYALFIAWMYYRQHRRWRAIVALGAPVVVLVSLRLLIPAANNDAAYLATLPDAERLVQLGTAEYGVGFILSAVLPWRVRSFDALAANALTFDSWGVLILGLSFLVFVKDRHIRMPLLAVMMITSAQVLAAVNIQRTVLAALPIVLLLVVPPFMRLPRSGSAIVSLSLGAVFFAVVTLFWGRLSLPVLIQVAFWLCFVGVSWIIQRIRRGSWYAYD